MCHEDMMVTLSLCIDGRSLIYYYLNNKLISMLLMLKFYLIKFKINSISIG